MSETNTILHRTIDRKLQLTKRQFIVGSAASILAVAAPTIAEAHPHSVTAPTVVRFRTKARPGSIIVRTGERRLYYVLSGGRALQYIIGVGKAGRSFRGTGRIGRKAKWPSWTPTKNMIRREPGKYARYARGVPGGPNNPLGARALYLYKSGRDTMYRIHGTNDPSSVGRAVSNGCIRLLNEHVEDLYARVGVGARVYVQ